MTDIPNKNRKFHKHFNKKKKPNNEIYVPQGNPELLRKTVEELNLNEKTLEVLKKGNVNTVVDIIKYRERELYRIQNFNKKNLLDVKDKISALGLKFRPDVEEQARPEPQPQQNREDRIKVFSNGRTDERFKNTERKPEENKPQQAQPNQENNKSNNKSMYDSAALSKRPQARTSSMKEEKLPFDALVKYNKDNKFGFRDLRGKVIIPAVYDDIFNFKEDLAAAEQNGKYGYIDKQNNVVIPFNYDLAMSFSEGFAVVTIGEKSGYIDKQGNVIIEAKYDAATAFQDGAGRVKIDGKWATITPDGKLRMV